MAERRMFAKTIVLSDDFLDMPLSARCLYFTLGMFADDDGFVNSPKGIMRHCGASQDDMNLLIAKKFVLLFDSGIIVIKHWRINNYLRSDRHQTTKYVEEMDKLVINDNGSYSFGIPNVVYQGGIPSIDKNRLGKDNIYILSSSSTDSSEEKTEKECSLSENIHEIVCYLNTVCGKNYKESTQSTRKHITARLREGFTVEDFKRVIDAMNKKWGSDENMKQYLRPETLFGTKFESYLNNAPKVKVKKPKKDEVVETIDLWGDD